MNMQRYKVLVTLYMSEGMSRAKAEKEARETLTGGAIVPAPRQVDARGMGDFSHLDEGATPTPEQSRGAYERMMQSEMADPTGIYSDGGMEAGGIFGSGAVSFNDHDANSRMRAVQVRANMALQQATQDNSRLLAAMEEQNRLLRAQNSLTKKQLKAAQREEEQRLLQAAQDLEDDEDDLDPEDDDDD